MFTAEAQSGVDPVRLVTARADEGAKLAAEPPEAAELAKSQGLGEDEDDVDEETNEAAYAEIVEYVRVAAQLTYEELAEFRGQASAMPSEPKETLH